MTYRKTAGLLMTYQMPAELPMTYQKQGPLMFRACASVKSSAWILVQAELAALMRSSTHCPRMRQIVEGRQGYAQFPVPVSKLSVRGKVVEQSVEEFVVEVSPMSGKHQSKHLEEARQSAGVLLLVVLARSELHPGPRIDCRCDRG